MTRGGAGNMLGVGGARRHLGRKALRGGGGGGRVGGGLDPQAQKRELLRALQQKRQEQQRRRQEGDKGKDEPGTPPARDARGPAPRSASTP